jgi:hypothetical protein
MAAKPTKQQKTYGKARAGGNKPMRITAEEVKRTAKGVAKTAAIAATVVGPGKFIKAAKAVKAAKSSSKLATRNEARVIAAKRAEATPAGKRTEAEKLAMKRVVKGKSGKLYTKPESKTDVNKLVKEAKKSSKPNKQKEAEYEKFRTTQYNPKTGKREEIVAGSSKASQARMTEFKRQGFGQSGNVVRKSKKK